MDVRRIVTIPFWETREERDGELVLRINIGTAQKNAFGFGGHPTSSLSLALLGGLFRDSAPRPRRVLDVGCGSGVLSIACARLGAAEVRGIDVSADAVALAKENAASNGVQCAFDQTPVADVPGTFDLVLANLPNSTVLRQLAPDLAARARGGLLIISGYQEQYRSVVVPAFEKAGCELRVDTVRDGWCGALLEVHSSS